MTTGELQKDFKRLELKAPSPRPGREAGFTFYANGLTVVVWTTFVESEGEAREKDAGWVLIKENDNALYYSHPVYRTKNFLYRLLERAAIAKQRVLLRPLCPACSAFMRITRGKGLKSRYWSCRSPAHPHTTRLSWDDGLPPEVLERVKAIRKKRDPYPKKREAEGKPPPGTAMLNRKPWRVGKPENELG